MAPPPSELEEPWTGDAVTALAWQPISLLTVRYPFVGHQCPQVIMLGCLLKSHAGEVLMRGMTLPADAWFAQSLNTNNAICMPSGKAAFVC